MADYRGPPRETPPRTGGGSQPQLLPAEYPPASRGTQAGSRLRLVEWKAVRKNTLCGFAVVELPNGLIVRELSVHVKGEKRWASMPAKPVLGPDGKHLEKDGKKVWSPLVGWRDRALADEFGRRVIALVEAQHPGDLDKASA
jgi:hypothetical protein